MFLIKVLKQTWKSFHITFWTQRKEKESSYQVRQLLAFFCILITLILGENCVKDIRFINIFKEIKFAWIRDELKAKLKIKKKEKCFQRLRAKFSFALMSAFIFLNSHIFARIYFISVKSILKQISMSFNTKFQRQ